MDTSEAPKTKFCPDCGEERPASEFYRTRNSLSRFCKPHQAIRNYQRQQEKLQQLVASDPSAVAQWRDQRRLYNREYGKRRRASPDARRKMVAALARYRSKPEYNSPEARQRRADVYREWAERNPDRRRQTQDEWLRRQSWKGYRARDRSADTDVKGGSEPANGD